MEGDGVAVLVSDDDGVVVLVCDGVGDVVLVWDGVAVVVAVGVDDVVLLDDDELDTLGVTVRVELAVPTTTNP